MKIRKILNNLGLSIVTVSGIVTMTSCGHKKTPTPPPPTPPASGIYSPFVDVTMLQGAGTGRYSNLIDYYMNPGVRHMMLGFVQQGSNSKNPHAQWAGTTEIDGSDPTTAAAAKYIINTVSRFQSVGGDVCVSFGGASGTSEWTLSTATATNLASDITRVANAFKTKYIDFDIEGAVVNNIAANKKLAAACAQIWAKDPNMRFTLTLPVLRTGLTNDGLAVLHNFYETTKHNTIINIMAMDYGGVMNDMDKAAEEAADATVAQIATAYKITNEAAYKLLGVTPMIGYNDTPGEVMSLKQYTNVGAYLRTKKAFMYGQWSLNRDYPATKEGSGGPTSTGLLANEAAALSFTTAGLTSFGDKGGPTEPVSGEIALSQYLVTARDFGAYWTKVKNALRYKIIVDNNTKNPYYSMINNLILETPQGVSTTHTFKVIALGINNSEVDSKTLTIDNSKAKLPSLVTMFKVGNVYQTGDLFIYKKIIYRAKYWYNGTELPNISVAVEVSAKFTLDNLAENGYSQQAITDLENDKIWNIVKLS